MMESAQDFIDRYFDGRFKLHGELANMLSERDSKIRKECADRAVEWAKKWADFPMGNHGEGALRAVIMGKKEKKDD